jgi:hypothetical protein
MRKSIEDVRLLVAQLINEENDNHAKRVATLDFCSDLTKAQELIEVLSFAHKKSIALLERIYKEL